MHTDSHLLAITTDNASTNYLMTCQLQSAFEASGIVWPLLRNNIPSMAHVIQLLPGVIRSSLGVEGPTECSEAHERDYQFGENECFDNGNSPLLRKIIGIVCIWRNFESFIIHHYQVEIVWWIDYTYTWSSKQAHSVLQLHCANCSTILMDVTTQWNSTLESLERAYWFRYLACKLLLNPKFSDYWPLSTI
jgi:hypothetical protein